MKKLIARVPVGVVLTLGALAVLGGGFHDGR
jgi:hypothetical protein